MVSSPAPLTDETHVADAKASDEQPTLARSNYHLESNPFEQSFSQPHHQPALTAYAPPSPPRKLMRPPSKDAPDSDDQHVNTKPTLPPIAAMASPSGSNDFAWAFNSNGSLQGSLRSGPLSPAMLAGPQQYHPSHSAFDPSSLRTGLTPDVSRTGLTPLIGGPTSFPPPSPNTAAFIAMVTSATQNGNTNSSSTPATITPGTFSAITGILNSNGTNGANASTNTSQSSSAYMNGNGSNGNTTHQPHPLSISHVPDHPPESNGAKYSPTTNNSSTHYSSQHDAHTAANGLFLLSQAHQELAKREEQQMQQQQAQSSPPNTGRKGARSSAGTKRKGTDEPRPAAPASKKPRGGAGSTSGRSSRKGRKKSEESTSMDGGSGAEEGESDDDGGSANGDHQNNNDRDEGRPKRPETEEEKRKNFLERNRQAALKCRQRKKAWLTQLQAKVEFLTSENERLQNTTVSMREEITRLSAVVVAHRDCGLGGVSVARSEALIASNSHIKSTEGHVPSNAPSTRGSVSKGRNGSSVPPVSAPPNASAMVQPVGGMSKSRGYGY